MTTTASHSQSLGFGDTYDPDGVLPGSPLMTPLRPRLAPTPSPPPDIPAAQVSLSPASADNSSKSNRHKIRPNSGDAVLVAYLDDGRDPEKAREAARQVLPYEDEDSPENSSLDESADDAAMTAPSLRNLAADALAFANPPRPAHVSSPSSALNHKLNTDISLSTRRLSIRDDHPSLSYPHARSDGKHGLKSPSLAVVTPNSGELPPIMDSPRSETHGPVLPSIRSTLGDIDRLSTNELVSRHRSSAGYTGSPSTAMPRLPAITHTSPPVSPNENYAVRNFPSPNSASSPYYYGANGMQRPSADFSGSSTTGETPNSERSAPTPASSATSASVADRMSIDGITNPLPGPYVCTVPGCTAQPFQTQYLLNSHANVHSSARPHYCSVQGCPRSEGGKGFKRKNEMIRHGLVHDSPGYVCPFCPDREHKYPRPDNLQRHVRVHHVDKDKDDPALRDVLSQRPDGPNRGRRRRGPP